MARLPAPHLPVVLSVFLSSLGSTMETLAASLHFTLTSIIIIIIIMMEMVSWP